MGGLTHRSLLKQARGTVAVTYSADATSQTDSRTIRTLGSTAGASAPVNNGSPALMHLPSADLQVSGCRHDVALVRLVGVADGQCGALEHLHCRRRSRTLPCCAVTGTVPLHLRCPVRGHARQTALVAEGRSWKKG